MPLLFKKLMPTTLLLLMFLSTVTTYGQTNESIIKKLYLQLGTGLTNYNGYSAGFDIQAVLKKHWTATLSYHNITMDPKNLPSNYEPGFELVLIFPFSDAYPESNMKLYSLSAGKFFELGRKFWFVTEAGVSVVNGDKFTFIRQPMVQDSYGHTSSNYGGKKEIKTTFGGVLKADLTWAFSSFAGLGVGVFGNFNSIQSPVGAELKLIVGWMNRRPKIK